MDDDELKSILRAKLPTIGSQRGPKMAEKLTYGPLRELGEADLAVVFSPKEKVSGPVIQKLRSTHHRLAQLLAAGHKQVEVAAITGYTQTRISILKGDPAFQELITYYQNQSAHISIDVQERLADLGIQASEIIQERLEEAPESFSVRELLEVQAGAFDRSVAPVKRSDRVETSVTLSWAQMVEAARKPAPVIDITPIPGDKS